MTRLSIALYDNGTTSVADDFSTYDFYGAIEGNISKTLVNSALSMNSRFNASPHYGHLVPGTIKDIVPRYQTMKGHRVVRNWGWDCHGLPVENEMKKKLGISSAKEIQEYGVAKYNEECRSIVLRFTSDWKNTITRMGRWVDFEHGYKTMDLGFMESIWWVFKTLYDKGLIYKGYNILPYSPGLGCPLSNMEVNLGGYRDVTDPAITVRFRVRDTEDTYFLAWTTTPWTLPSNLALALGPDIDYVKILDNESGDKDTTRVFRSSILRSD